MLMLRSLEFEDEHGPQWRFRVELAGADSVYFRTMYEAFEEANFELQWNVVFLTLGHDNSRVGTFQPCADLRASMTYVEGQVELGNHLFWKGAAEESRLRRDKRRRTRGGRGRGGRGRGAPSSSSDTSSGYGDSGGQTV